MALSWGKRRRTLYLTVAGVLAAIALVYIYLAFFTVVPSCNNGVMDEGERGVDCGGTCALVCRDEAKPATVLWNRIFQTAPGYYTAAAYIENKNTGSGAKRVSYSFQLFNAQNHLVIERTGTMDLPPVQTIAVVEPNIYVGNALPTRVLFSLADEPVWYRPSVLPALRVAGQSLAPDASRLQVTVANDSTADARKVTVAAVLFDSAGIARGASKSVVDVGKKSSTPVVFTWPSGVPDIVRAEVVVLPSF